MIPKKFAAALAVSCVVIVSVVMLTSFKRPVKAKEKACVVYCTWSPATSAIANVAMDNCISSNNASNVSSSQLLSLQAVTCTTVNIYTYIGPTHPAGTVRIYKNGTQVYSQALAANQDVFLDASFSAYCWDEFLVTW